MRYQSCNLFSQFYDIFEKLRNHFSCIWQHYFKQQTEVCDKRVIRCIKLAHESAQDEARKFHHRTDNFFLSAFKSRIWHSYHSLGQMFIFRESTHIYMLIVALKKCEERERKIFGKDFFLFVL